jgi:hypothetical protein
LSLVTLTNESKENLNVLITYEGLRLSTFASQNPKPGSSTTDIIVDVAVSISAILDFGANCIRWDKDGGRK